MKDRRKFMRFEVPLKAEVFIDVESKGLDSCEIRDLSRYGIRAVVMNRALAEGANIILKITNPDSQRAVPLTGEVAWANGATGSGLEIGVRIKDMDKKAKSELLEYAYREWKRKEIKKIKGDA